MLKPYCLALAILSMASVSFAAPPTIICGPDQITVVNNLTDSRRDPVDIQLSPGGAMITPPFTDNKGCVNRAGLTTLTLDNPPLNSHSSS